MSLLRAFIAIELPSSIQNAIQQETAALCQALDRSIVRWVPPQNVHLTLKFLGDVSPSNLGLLKQMIEVEASQYEPFDLSVGGCGSFPNPKRARIIWVGIQAPATLSVLQHSIETAAARLGYPPEDRPFSPHLTIGRVSQHISGDGQQRLRQALEKTQISLLGSTRVDAIHLFRSDLQPSGPIYTTLFKAALKDTN